MIDNTTRKQQHEPSDSTVIRGYSRHQCWTIAVSVICTALLLGYCVGYIQGKHWRQEHVEAGK